MKYQLLLQNIIKCTTKAGKDTLQMEVSNVEKIILGS